MRIYKFLRNLPQVQKGFTLIEAMIAVVVFSFGLLGVASVMIVSVKNNHNGYMRSQATFLAHSMIDMMRKNSWSVWRNQYNGTFSGNSTIVTCGSGNPCGCAAVANRDTQLWSNMIEQTLPAGVGTILCAETSALPISDICQAADVPYSGICTVTVSWSESNEIDAVDQQQIIIQTNP